MKKIMILLFISFVIFGCDKEETKDNIQLIETIPGGCAATKSGSLKTSEYTSDTVVYSFSDEELNFLVAFNAACCGEYSTTSEYKENAIYINITKTNTEACHCLCNYTFDFKYSGVTESHDYVITLDSLPLMSGKIEH